MAAGYAALLPFQAFSLTMSALMPFNLKETDTFVISAGVPFGMSGKTNMIQVRSVGDVKLNADGNGG